MTYYCPSCGADTSNPCGCIDDGIYEAREAYNTRLASDIDIDEIIDAIIDGRVRDAGYVPPIEQD